MDTQRSDRIDDVVTIPDGRIATEHEMRSCARALQQFVRDTEARLAGVADAREHNRIVDFLREIAGKYNAQLRLFREAEQRRVMERQMLWAKLLAASISPEQRRTRH